MESYKIGDSVIISPRYDKDQIDYPFCLRRVRRILSGMKYTITGMDSSYENCWPGYNNLLTKFDALNEGWFEPYSETIDQIYSEILCFKGFPHY